MKKSLFDDNFFIILFTVAGIAVLGVGFYTGTSVITTVFTALIVLIGVLSFYANKRKQDAFLDRIRQQELMSELSRDFVSSRSAAALISGALQITGEFLGADRMIIGVEQANSDITHLAYVWNGSDKAVPPSHVTGLNDLIKNVFPAEWQENVPVIYCNDIQKDSRYGIINTVGRVKAFIWAPLYVEKNYWAVLGVGQLEPRVWTQSDRQLVSMVSSVIAGAVERDLREKERDAARQSAEKASRAKSDFLANMSHEMRTPMNAIIGMTAIAKNSNELEKKEYCLTRIENVSVHLLGVINDILDMSKIEANKFELSPAEFNFEKMLQKMVNVINYKIEEKKQNFSVHIDRNIPPVLFGDDQRLAQVIANLLSNAVKFTPAAGSIQLDAELERRESGFCFVRISVADTGIGISPEQQTRLFTSFEQAETGTSRQFGGTGLGLAISKRIVEMMGGGFCVRSELGKGAVFTFTARFQEVSELEYVSGPEDVAAGVTTVGVAVPRFDGKRLLLAEDVDINREIVVSLLEPTGVVVDCAGNGLEAVKLFKRNPNSYDMIFMDVQMPLMDGYTATRQIRAFETETGKNHGIPIIAMTANVFREDVEKCLEAGMNGHLDKPLDIGEVLDQMHRFL